VAKDTDYLAYVEKNTPKLKPYIDALPTAKARPATAAYPKVSLAFAKEVEQAVYGKKTVDQALTDAESTVNSILQSGQ
jgi:multiple sugar transport system substrate-binding protein